MLKFLLFEEQNKNPVILLSNNSAKALENAAFLCLAAPAL
jgi:ribonucleotide monophosphatase NagD (HAD superfamily)